MEFRPFVHWQMHSFALQSLINTIKRSHGRACNPERRTQRTWTTYPKAQMGLESHLSFFGDFGAFQRNHRLGLQTIAQEKRSSGKKEDSEDSQCLCIDSIANFNKQGRFHIQSHQEGHRERFNRGKNGGWGYCSI